MSFGAFGAAKLEPKDIEVSVEVVHWSYMPLIHLTRCVPDSKLAIGFNLATGLVACSRFLGSRIVVRSSEVVSSE